MTGLFGLSMRFCTTTYGLPIGVHLVSKMWAESTVLHLAAMLDAESGV